MQTGEDEMNALAEQDSAEKIEADITEALTAGCDGMIDFVV